MGPNIPSSFYIFFLYVCTDAPTCRFCRVVLISECTRHTWRALPLTSSTLKSEQRPALLELGHK